MGSPGFGGQTKLESDTQTRTSCVSSGTPHTGPQLLPLQIEVAPWLVGLPESSHLVLCT